MPENEITGKVRLGCEFAEALYSRGKIVLWKFTTACPFGKEAVDKACVHCRHVTEEVIEDE